MSVVIHSAGVEQTVRVHCSHEHVERLQEVNGLLAQGWQVVSVTSAEKAGYGGQYPDVFFFVVLERQKR